MPNAQQIIALIRSREKNDDGQFYSIALQIAASETRKGHKTVADELMVAVEKARSAISPGRTEFTTFPKLPGELEELNYIVEG